MTIDISNPVQTRGGKRARIICSDRKGNSPIIALITESDGTESVRHFERNGRPCETPGVASDRDLINVPSVIRRWAVITLKDRGAGPRAGYAYLFTQRPDNPMQVGGIGEDAFACISIEFREGEGIWTTLNAEQRQS